eukprot:Hpha_TRINITY_DN15629_c2_g1::TRINITY_DN15629_c2_g1_i1::g.99601::m.99601
MVKGKKKGVAPAPRGIPLVQDRSFREVEARRAPKSTVSGEKKIVLARPEPGKAHASVRGPENMPVLDRSRLDLCCAAILRAAQKEEKGNCPIYLQWTSVTGTAQYEERMDKRFIMSFHSPWERPSVLYVGSNQRKCSKKNKKGGNWVDTVESVKHFNHKRRDQVELREKEALEKYKFILVDNRCRRLLPPEIRKKVNLEMDCSSLRFFARNLRFAVNGVRLKVGRGVCSVRIGTGGFSSGMLQDNVLATLAFLERHADSVLYNIKEASVVASGMKPLRLFKRDDADVLRCRQVLAARRAELDPWSAAAGLDEDEDEDEDEDDESEENEDEGGDESDAAPATRKTARGELQDVDVFSRPPAKRPRRSELLRRLL